MVNTEGGVAWVQVWVIYLEIVMPMAKPVNKPYVSGFAQKKPYVSGSEIVGVTSVGTNVGILTFERP